jgi:hypothetical protein
MHQKLLWSGAALVVLGAAAGYFAVDYGYSHPGSLLARLGVAATFAGLNPNPLSDINPAVFGKRPVIEARISKPGRTQTNTFATDPTEETIEPIQIEALPLSTAEPPTGAEESEWRPMFERITEEWVTGTVPLQDTINLVVPVEQAPKRMPYADEDVDEDAQADDGCGLMPVIRCLQNLRWSLPSILDWEAVGELLMRGESGGCLNWDEYSTPELVPVMPREVKEENTAAWPPSKRGVRAVWREVDVEAAAEIAALRVEAVLDLRQVTLSFDDVPLYKCVQDIKDCLGNVKIVADDQAIEAAGIHMDQPITLHVSDVSAKSALTHLLKKAGLTYVIENKTITITPLAPVEGKKKRVVISVCDLVVPATPAKDQ